MIEITPFLGITLISLALSLMISVIYRVLTKPGEVRKAKEDMNFFKNKMSEAQKAGDKQLRVAVDLGEDTDATFAYAGEEHAINYKGIEEGSGAGFTIGVDFDDDGRFSPDETFDRGEVFSYKGAFWRANPAMEGFFIFATEKEDAIHFEMLVAQLPFALPFLGSYLTWFWWWYLFLSIPSTLVFRKLLGVE